MLSLLKRVFRLKFDDVAECKDVKAFNKFVRVYCRERGILCPSVKATKIYWALFSRWKSEFLPVNY